MTPRFQVGGLSKCWHQWDRTKEGRKCRMPGGDISRLGCLRDSLRGMGVTRTS